MKKVIFGLVLAGLFASPCGAASLKLTIHDGMVTLDAQDVTVRQILTEWARLGKTTVKNLETVSSGPMTLKLDNVPEKTALDIILRAVPGYVAAQRATYLADASLYDRILIMSTTTAVPARAAAAPQPVQGYQPNVTQLRVESPLMNPGFLPQPTEPDPEDELEEDPAIAAAAAAGLITVPAPSPVRFPPGARQPPTPTPPATTTTTPTSPWTPPAGSPLPTFAPTPTAPTTPQPVNPLRPPVRPPVPDR